MLAMGFRAQLALSLPATARRIPSAWIASDFIPTDTFVCRAWSMLARRVPRIVITYSKAAATQGALRGARTCVVHPGIEHDRFPLGPDRREPLLAFVGHLTPLKTISVSSTCFGGCARPSLTRAGSSPVEPSIVRGRRCLCRAGADGRGGVRRPRRVAAGRVLLRRDRRAARRAAVLVHL